MNLRTKLLLAFLVFVVALMALGAWSARRIDRLGKTAEHIIANNYDSVVAAQDMKESLERLDDTADLFALRGDAAPAVQQVAVQRTRFDRAFARAANNITKSGETEVIAHIARERDSYYTTLDALLQADDADTNYNKLETLFGNLREHCDALLRLNQAAMLAKSDSARSTADAWFRQMIVVATLLTLAGLALAVVLSERIVRPVRELTRTTAQLAGGNLDVRARIASHDEIGLLAAEYNRMAERLRQLRRTDKGKLLLARQTAEAALGVLDDPLIVTDSEGCVTQLNHAAAEIFGAETVGIGRRLADTSLATYRDDQLINVGTRSFRILTTPLHDADEHPLGNVLVFKDTTALLKLGASKDSLLRDAAAQLREPLGNAQTAAHILLTEQAGDLNQKQQEMLFDVRAACEQIEDALRRLSETA